MKLTEIAISKAEKNPAIEAFMKEFKAETYPHPFARGMRIKDDVGIDADNYWNKEVHLLAIMNFGTKGEGGASKALDWFVGLADKYKVELSLEVKAMKNAGSKGKNLSKANLFKWYESRGFKKVGGDHMRRMPK